MATDLATFGKLSRGMSAWMAVTSTAMTLLNFVRKLEP
jgi:hypothetical protein